MIHIRPMTHADLPLGLRLSEQAGFNQTEADWRRFLALGPEGCFVAELDEQPVGTVTTCLFGSVGWIAMLLVDKRFRSRGIGTRLMLHALDCLDRHGARTARLDATARGRPIYQKLGFAAEYTLARLEMAAPQVGPVPDVATVQPDQLETIFALDAEATGTDRVRLLERLHRERPDAMLVTGDPTIAGYVAFRSGRQAMQIGPLVATDPQIGLLLADAALARCAPERVFVDVPVDNQAAMQWAQSKGFTVQRYFTRMYRGVPVTDRPESIWASSGPEKG